MQIIPALRGTWTRHDMNMETMRHSQILYFCKERRPLIIMLPHTCATCIVPPVLIVWHGLILNKPIYISPTLHAPGPKQNRVSNDPLTNLQEVTTRKKDVYFIVWRLGHTVIVNQAMCCICHNLFWYFCLKVSVCPKRRLLTVRALFKSRSPDECCEEHFKCQQTMFLTC